jgi:hypothetical protein
MIRSRVCASAAKISLLPEMILRVASLRIESISFTFKFWEVLMRSITLLVLVSILGSSSIAVGQNALKRVKGRPLTDSSSALKSPGPPLAAGTSSLSGRLKLNGAHSGLLGILEIETDISLEGPLLIEVSANGSPVSQRSGDTSGRLELQLTRKKQISVAVKLGGGNNLIQVVDAVNRDERAALEWTGVEVDNGSTASESPSEPERTDSRTMLSASGRLSVTGRHTKEKAILDVFVGTLIGPFTVKVIDGSQKVLAAKKKELRRGETSFAETLPLENGPYLITIASDDFEERDESVTLGPWSFTLPEATDAGTASAAKEIKVSNKTNLSATVARVNNSCHLIVHIADQMKGFKVKVVDADNKEVDSKAFQDLSRAVNDWSVSVKAAKGVNTVTVSSLDDAETVTLLLPEAAALVAPQDSVQLPAPSDMVEYDWGRVRGYFAAGMIFSKERDDFSHSDIFLDFTLDKNYVARPWFKIWPDTGTKKHFLFKDLNTFFNARLTSIPVTAEDTSEPKGGDAEKEECNTPDCKAFISSKKAAMMQVGIYAPMYWDFTTWYRNDKNANGVNNYEKNALFVAPLAKAGILTVTGDRQTAEARQFGQDDVFNFFSVGAMLGHFKLHTRKNANGFYENNPNVAPELISWLTLSIGRWENFEVEVPTGQKNAMGNDINVRRRPWRYEALGRLKIPETPFIIGFDGNFGKGPDDVRFLFGTRFDIGKIMRTLKLASAQGTLGGSTPPAAAPAPAAAPVPNPDPNPSR